MTFESTHDGAHLTVKAASESTSPVEDGHGPIAHGPTVTQTLTVDTPGRLGNCMPAAIATFLGIPLEQVPHFIEWGAVIATGDRLRWQEDTTHWRDLLVGYAWGRGYHITPLGSLDEADPGEVVFVNGPSPRGVAHQVLYRDGELWWDPHPSRAGVESIDEVEAWRPVTHDHTELTGEAS